MRRCDCLIVGGGPAGAACAARLVAAGRDVVVLDRAAFPRLKLCAGWITPEVVADVGLDPASYPHRFSTFPEIHAHFKGLTFRLAGPQHSIRRYEFDAWLLGRAGAEVRVHNARRIERVDGGYRVDEAFEGRWLIGAGGTRCPVYRTFFREANPRSRALQVATLEHEVAYEWRDPRCHLWFFDHGLPGYAWYVPKAGGYLNLGIGAMAEQLRARGQDLRTHWARFIARLRGEGLIGADLELAPKGYSYYARGDVTTVRIDDAFLCGDAAGLATRDLCEGIGPAVRSGQRAAEAILTGCRYRLDDLPAHSSEHAAVRWLLEYLFAARSRRAA